MSLYRRCLLYAGVGNGNKHTPGACPSLHRQLHACCTNFGLLHTLCKPQTIFFRLEPFPQKIIQDAVCTFLRLFTSLALALNIELDLWFSTTAPDSENCTIIQLASDHLRGRIHG